MLLKIMHSNDLSPVDADNQHSIYGDVTSCNFIREGDRAYARIYVRDPVKAAQVPGFVEHEQLIDINGPAYLMNEAGKTVSSFTPMTSGDPRRMVPVGAPNASNHTT